MVDSNQTTLKTILFLVQFPTGIKVLVSSKTTFLKLFLVLYNYNKDKNIHRFALLKKERKKGVEIIVFY